jgi:hypothetical protein
MEKEQSHASRYLEETITTFLYIILKGTWNVVTVSARYLEAWLCSFPIHHFQN